jgi:hypothetical protein
LWGVEWVLEDESPRTRAPVLVWRTTQRSRRQHCETTEEGDVGRYRTNPCHRQALEGEPSQFLSLPAFERERLEAAPVGLFLRKKKLSVRANGMSLAELVQDRRGADWERCRIWCAGSRLTDAARETWFEEAWRRADSGGKKRVLSESQGDPCCFQALWKSDRGDWGARARPRTNAASRCLRCSPVRLGHGRTVRLMQVAAVRPSSMCRSRERAQLLTARMPPMRAFEAILREVPRECCNSWQRRSTSIEPLQRRPRRHTLAG